MPLHAFAVFAPATTPATGRVRLLCVAVDGGTGDGRALGSGNGIPDGPRPSPRFGRRPRAGGRYSHDRVVGFFAMFVIAFIGVTVTAQPDG